MTVPQSFRKNSLIWVYTDSLAEELDSASWLEMARESRELGWDVFLITAGPSDQMVIKGIPVTSIPKPEIYLIGQLIFHIRVLRFIFSRWKETEVILFHQMSAPWLLPLKWVRQLSKRPFPITVMDTRTAPMIPKAGAGWKDRLRIKYDALMNRLANHLADGQTAITVRMAEMMKIPDSKLLGVWPSGVFLERFAPAQAKRNWPLANQEVYLVYIGALYVQRNLMNLCQAVEIANAAGKCFIFTLVGWGPERDNLTAFAEKTNGRIRVFPAIPHEEIPDLLALAHIGVLPFPDQERFRVSSPIKLFEYMASGLPVLVTRIVCHTDVIGSADFAFWSDGSDQDSLLAALDQIWMRRHDLPELGEQAGRAAEEWTWKESANKLSNALNKGLERSA